MTLMLFGLTLILAASSAYVCVSDPFFRSMIALAKQSDLLASRYFGEVSPEHIFDDAWRGMQEAIPFRVDLAQPENYSQTISPVRDWGLTLSPQDSAVEVMDIAESSPFHGFLHPDDKITGVDTLRKENIGNLVKYLDSREKGETRIYFERQGRSDSVTVQISVAEASGAAKFETADSIGYLKLALPGDEGLRDQIATMKESNASGIIIDLRSSEGSDYQRAAELSEEVIEAIANRPIVALIDANTKGASEEIARKIGNGGTAVTMGSPSAGLLAVIEEIELRSGGRLLVSTNERITRQLFDENDSVKAPGPPANAVIPAMSCTNRRMSALMFELLHGGYILDFVTQSRYDAIPSVAEEDSLLMEFVTFLGHRRFRYDPLGHILSDMSLNEMDENMLPVYTRMRQTHRELGDADLTEYRNEIVRNLLRTIHRVKLGGEPSMTVRARTDDVCLSEAIAYLKGAAK
ncbi:MAG: hypothetical protein WBP29_14165 [Candidatus Zixiibacteriota bacterium]